MSSSGFCDQTQCKGCDASPADGTGDIYAARQIAKNSSMVSFAFVEPLMDLGNPVGIDERVAHWIRAGILRQRAQVLAQQIDRNDANPIQVVDAIVSEDGVFGKWLVAINKCFNTQAFRNGREEAKWYKAELEKLRTSQHLRMRSIDRSKANTALRKACEDCHENILSATVENDATRRINKSLDACVRVYRKTLRATLDYSHTNVVPRRHHPIRRGPKGSGSGGNADKQ
jgi:hypothetical protein